MYRSELTKFLIAAKPETYAGADDNASVSSPLLCGSQQLEYQSKDWLYRDIYFGISRFTGLEFVYQNDQPRWAMSYSGGVKPGIELNKALDIYKFLRTALIRLPEAFPIRGPKFHQERNCQYKMVYYGVLDAFSGQETIKMNGEVVYELWFAGGTTE